MLGLLYEVYHEVGEKTSAQKWPCDGKNAISRIAAFLDHKIQSQKKSNEFFVKAYRL